MARIPVPQAAAKALGLRRSRFDPVFQAFVLLRTGFTIAPMVFGLDMFLDIALRDLGLLLAPLTLGPLATAFEQSVAVDPSQQ